MKHIFLILCIFMAGMAHAQIGYQVALLDSQTGEPRTNEKVNVTVKITDSKGTTVCSEQQTATSDAFGVLSLTIGNENTFANVDWQNLPLSISATVNGILIGSCNILNVPVAEHAKHTGVLTPQILGGKSVSMYDGEAKMTFTSDGSATYTAIWGIDDTQVVHTKYEINGNYVHAFRKNGSCWTFYYSPQTGKLHYFGD